MQLPLTGPLLQNVSDPIVGDTYRLAGNPYVVTAREWTHLDDTWTVNIYGEPA